MDPQLTPVVSSVPPQAAPVSPAPQAPALAEPLMQIATQVQPVQPVSMGAGRKEAPGTTQEVSSILEMVGQDAIEAEPLPAEVESWMEKVGGAREMPPAEMTVTLPQPPVTLVNPPVPKQVFVVPLGKTEFQAGLHASVHDSVHWLAIWCRRLIKQFGTQVVFKE